MATLSKYSIKKLPIKALQLVPNSPIGDEEKRFISLMLSDEWDGRKYISLNATPEEKELLMKILNAGFNSLAFDDRDKFWKKFGSIVDEQGRNNLWMDNHRRILSAISNLTKNYNRFPSRHELSAETSLSQQTINKHLANYFGSTEYSQKKDEFLLMRESVLATMFREAKGGDPRAAKVFLTATDQFAQPPIIKNQTNYLQFNSLTITQEQLKELPPEKLEQVQQILSLVAKPELVIQTNHDLGTEGQK